jgi:hypothetical protein
LRSVFQPGSIWSACCLFVTFFLGIGSSAWAQLGTVAVGSSSQPLTVTLTAQTGGMLTSLAALTSGSPNLDFSVTSGGTCAVNMTLNTGETCTVSVVFSPLYPGVRQGAVIAIAGSQLIASTLVYGTGQGSLPVLVPGTINTVAGTTTENYQGDGVLATLAPINLPSGLAVDGAGDLFLCDTLNNRVRRVDATTHDISTVAGGGSGGDGGPATNAELIEPSGVAIDGAGNLYISDSGNNAVRRVDAVSGIITTFAGQLGSVGSSGDGVAATAALLNSPRGLALTPTGDLVIADSGNNLVRVVTMSSQQISTVAGKAGVAGYSGDGGLATEAELNLPYGVAVRQDGAIAIADRENQRVRLVSTLGVISTIAGSDAMGYGGDGGSPTQAQLNEPADVAFDAAGDLFIADAGNYRIRQVLGSNPGTIGTLVGSGSPQFSGDEGPANQATIYLPYAVLVDAIGNIWISDTYHNRVREVSADSLTISECPTGTTGACFPEMKVGNLSTVYAPAVVEEMYNEGNTNLLLTFPPTLDQAALDPGTTTCNASAMLPSSTCNMGIVFAPTEVGNPVSGSITWPSNAPNVPPIDHLSDQVLSVDVSYVAITSSANPGALGQPITLTATVTSAFTSRTGKVTFYDGSTALCSAVTLSSGGTATCTTSTLALGPHTITASYTGDQNNGPSTSPAFTEVIKRQLTLTLTASPNPAIATNSVTLTLTTGDPSPTPTGSVTFYDGTNTLQAVNFNNAGVATMSTSSLAVGTHSLTAKYVGDGSNMSGTSNPVNEVVNKAGTTTTLSSNSNPATVGTSVIFTATVASSGGPTPTGTVTFKNGSTSIGTCSLTNGTCNLTVSTLTPGSHSIVASYGGDADSASSVSSPLTETINQIGTTTGLSATPNPVNAGATLTLTANVAIVQGATADGALTGMVTFTDGSTTLGQGPLNGSGIATFQIATLSVGTHSLVATYGGATNYAGSTSSAVSETVQETATHTSLSSSATTTLVGKTASFTAAVTIASGIPTGSVEFLDGSTVIGTVTLNGSGVAVFSTSSLAKGMHSITAAFIANGNFAGSTSAAVEQNVVAAQPTLLLTGPTSAVNAGTTAQFVADLTTPGVTPTGTITLLNGGVQVGTADTVNAVGNYSFSTSTLSIGTHIMTASYSGDGNNSPVVSADFTVVVQQGASTTTLTTSVDPLTQGNSLTLSAHVTSVSPNLSGQISFYDGSTLLGTANLVNGATATFATTALTVGTHSLKAVYAGDTNHVGSTSATVTELVVQSTTATLTSSKNPAESGQSVTFTAQIGGGSGVPTGTATFKDNGNLLSNVPLNGSGAASITSSTLSVGAHTIVMNYSGDSKFATAQTQLVETVNDASTQITITANANPATYGQPVTLAATVTSQGAAATGSVNFTDAGVNIGSAQLNGKEVATITLSTLKPGTHTIVASYTGNGTATSSSSAPLTLTVKQTTTLTVSGQSNPALTLSPVNLVATIKDAGAAIATGTVTFTDAGATIGTASMDANGTATLTLTKMNAGNHDIVASYPGDGSDFGSTSIDYTETVQLRPTTTSVTGTAADASNPNEITLIGVVDGQGPVALSGNVTFTVGGTIIGQVTVGAAGVATIQAIESQLTGGVIASYSGDTNYAASKSPTTTITATPASQFNLTATPASPTLVSHQHTTISVNLGSMSGFSDTISLGCLGLPYAATCTFTPSQVKLSANGTTSASLILDTGDPLGAGAGTSASVIVRRGTYLAFLPLGLLVGFLRSKKHGAARRKLGILFACVFAVALSMGASGCGGLTMSGTPAGTYHIQVVGKGQATGITETQNITLVVTQ